MSIAPNLPPANVSVLKTNALNHNVNTGKRVIKLSGIWKYAAKGYTKEVSKYLGSQGPNIENEEKRTALHYAAENGHIAVVSQLLTAGANINARDMRGDTAMHCALRAKHEEMGVFLMGRGFDMNTTNTAGIDCWELAEKISRRFLIKLKENTKCSNPSASGSRANTSAPKPAAPANDNQLYNSLLNQVVLHCGKYIMYLRAVPPPGTPAGPALPAPYPPTPHDALKMTHGRFSGLLDQLVLAGNKDINTSPTFKGSCQSLKDHVSRQAELTKTPITDGLIYNSLHTDLFNIIANAIEMLAQYEESRVSRAFSTHIEKFTLSLRTAAAEPPSAGAAVSSDFLIDYVKLNRNVLAQLLYISSQEKSKNISDGLFNLSSSVQLFVESNNPRSGTRTATSPGNPHIGAIAGNLRKINDSMMQSNVSSALFPDEERAVFDTAIKVFESLLALPNIPFSAKRPIQIMLSEISYIIEASFCSPPDRDVLLNCALFIHCTCTRIAQFHTEQKRKEPLKSVVDHVAGLMTLCGNMVVLIAGALVTKNKDYHFVHIGYAIRAVAYGTAILVNPAYGIAL